MQGLKHYIIPFNVKEKESQYWLGYICADGNIQYSKKHRVYKVSLFSKDKEIIDKFMLFMGDRCHYYLRKQNGIHEAYINSKQLCEYLIELNIGPNKGLILNPNVELTSDFLRGHFDGDGSIRKGRKECKITCGSKVFVSRISKKLNELEIYYTIRTKGNAQDICIERAKSCEKLLHFLYQNSTLYLERKYLQYVALFGNK
jgi:DNA-binding transcriptional regulator WhiA